MNLIQKLSAGSAHTFGRVLSFLWPAPSAPPKSDVDYDEICVEGLCLRDAIAIRSAEFWLALGEPRLALNELESLSELAKRNAWAQQVLRHIVDSRQSFSE